MVSMFQLDMAFALELISLTLATILLVLVKIYAKQGLEFAKVVAYIIIVLSILALGCTSYYGMKYWFHGYFSTEHIAAYSKQHKMKHDMRKMHEKMKSNRPMGTN